MLAVAALPQIDIAILDQTEPGTHLYPHARGCTTPTSGPTHHPVGHCQSVIARIHAQRHTRPARRLLLLHWVLRRCHYEPVLPMPCHAAASIRPRLLPSCGHCTPHNTDAATIRPSVDCIDAAPMCSTCADHTAHRFS
eukprot:2220790-Prymnesium_polylepis.1